VPFALLLTHLAVRDQEPAELVHVPSATLLARQRGRSNPAASDSVLLAATGPPPEGGALPGGRKEVRWLASAFQGVTVQDEQAREASWPALDGFGALHFAAHAESNDDSPWHSGLLLGRSEDRETAGYLEASTIATMRLPARIAVLSACETAFGAILTGEGLTGLASAFLSAGVPTVVATQWKVDDRVTVDLMRAFYRSLSRGAGTARALQDARRVIASRAGTRDPFYWAGFIVVGEPGTTLAINPRNSPSGMLVVIGIVVVLAILALVWLRTHGRGGRSVAA